MEQIMDFQFVRQVELPKTIQISGYAAHEIACYHGNYFRDLLKRYAAKIGQSIPKEEEAKLSFVVDALTDFMHTSDSGLFIESDAIFRTVEIFNWNTVYKITDMLNKDSRLSKDSRSIFSKSMEISQKLNSDLHNTDSVCAAFALGMLSLKGLYVKICENCDYDLEFSKRRLTTEALAVSLIQKITYGFSLESEYLGEEAKYVTPKNVTQIEKIVADVMITDSERLSKISLS
jgi:hypothetical protein